MEPQELQPEKDYDIFEDHYDVQFWWSQDPKQPGDKCFVQGYVELKLKAGKKVHHLLHVSKLVICDKDLSPTQILKTARTPGFVPALKAAIQIKHPKLELP